MRKLRRRRTLLVLGLAAMLGRCQRLRRWIRARACAIRRTAAKLYG